jgi:hypothetical protein
MGAVPPYSDFPATNCNDHLGHAFILALNLLPHSVQLRGFCEDDGQAGSNLKVRFADNPARIVSRHWLGSN